MPPSKDPESGSVRDVYFNSDPIMSALAGRNRIGQGLRQGGSRRVARSGAVLVDRYAVVYYRCC